MLRTMLVSWGSLRLMDFNKPRVAIYYNVLPSTGLRHDGAPLFVNYNLRKLLDGVDCLKEPHKQNDQGNVVGLSPIDPTNAFGTFDLNGLIDYGEDGLGIPLDWEIPKPNFYWIADSHLGYEYRLRRAKQFDNVFISHKPSMEQMIKDGLDPAKVHYLPWAAEPSCYRPYPIIEKWDWCFIGHLNNDFRIDLIDRFCKEWPVGDRGYLGWRMPGNRSHNVLDDVAKKFSQSRIILNESVKDDLNMRTFEALACRRFLLTEDIPAVRDHFEDQKHLALFKTIDEAVEVATNALAYPDYRNKIAEAGYQEFLAHHTYMHRVKEILKTCINYIPEEKGELVTC